MDESPQNVPESDSEADDAPEGPKTPEAPEGTQEVVARGRFTLSPQEAMACRIQHQASGVGLHSRSNVADLRRLRRCAREGEPFGGSKEAKDKPPSGPR